MGSERAALIAPTAYVPTALIAHMTARANASSPAPPNARFALKQIIFIRYLNANRFHRSENRRSGRISCYFVEATYARSFAPLFYCMDGGSVL
ncbi:MAG: hypothetical protein ACLR06_03475 [Christensenellaceae bacterium]